MPPMRKLALLAVLAALAALACKPAARPDQSGSASDGSGQSKQAEQPPGQDPQAQAGPSEIVDPSTLPAPQLGDLGDAASPQCRAVMKRLGELEAIRAATPVPDAEIAQRVRAIWEEADGGGFSLRAWMVETDAALGRTPERTDGTDVAMVGQALEHMAVADEESTRARTLVDMSTRVRLVAFLEARRLLTAASDAEPKPKPGEARQPATLTRQWDEAWCLWSGAIRPLAATVDASPRGGEGWEQTIATAFEEGRAGIHGLVHDPLVTRPNRQIIEKGSYALIARLILERADARDVTGPIEAAMLLNLIEDRIADRNGPGLQRIRVMVFGDPANIDTAQIERELAVAFVKRARKYCDEAVIAGNLGTPDAIKGAWEGFIYTRVFLPSMRERMGDAGFDADAYLSDWEDYLVAVREGDSEGAAAISARLVEWNCAYQDRLGISECSSTSNEAQ